MHKPSGSLGTICWRFAVLCFLELELSCPQHTQVSSAPLRRGLTIRRTNMCIWVVYVYILEMPFEIFFYILFLDPKLQNMTLGLDIVGYYSGVVG